MCVLEMNNYTSKKSIIKECEQLYANKIKNMFKMY